MHSKLLRLTRPYVSLAVGLSALAGVLFSARTVDERAVLTFLGTFWLTCAVSLLNQIQERERDALMMRTRNRPLASGAMRPEYAWILFTALTTLAMLCLWAVFRWGAILVILMVIGLYNGLYTPLKTISGWAMIPGAVCGALPFWIGWIAGGGDMWSTVPLFFFTVYFIWQMPHFWMLAEEYADDYAAAGFAIPASRFSPFSRRMIPKLWTLSFAFIGCLAPLMGASHNQATLYIMMPLAWGYVLCVFLVRPTILRKLSDIYLAVLMLSCLWYF